MLRGRALPIGKSTATILFVATCAAAVHPAMAKVGIDLTGSATVGVEHDTNPFQLSSAEALPFGAEGTKRDDTSTRLAANANAGFIAGPIELQVLTSLTHVESDRFDGLSHTDYDVNGNLLWNSKQDGAYDFSLQYTQSHLPMGLADVGGSTAVEQRTRSAQGKLRVRPTPRWEVGLTPIWTESKTPLQNQPDFGYHLVSGRLSLGYMGAGRIVPGVAVTEVRSRYTGVDNNVRYDEQTFEGTLNYRTTGLSTISLAAGYTERTTRLDAPTTNPTALAIEGTSPAFTGSLNLHYQLSVKTGLNLNAYRYFQQYDAGVNTTVGTGFIAGAIWAATSKFTATLDTGFVWSTIQGVPLGAAVIERKDLVRSFSVTGTYAITRRLSLRSYVTRSVRNSTFGPDQFNGTIAGMELTARFD